MVLPLAPPQTALQTVKINIATDSGDAILNEGGNADGSLTIICRKYIKVIISN